MVPGTIPIFFLTLFQGSNMSARNKGFGQVLEAKNYFASSIIHNLHTLGLLRLEEIEEKSIRVFYFGYF